MTIKKQRCGRAEGKYRRSGGSRFIFHVLEQEFVLRKSSLRGKACDMEVGSLRCQVEEAVTTPPLGPQAAMDQQNQWQLSH